MSEVKTDFKIDLNNLDKSNWKTYRFDEIAKNISERIDPNNTNLKVYIGLEHIDSESLYIKRHGTPDDVKGQKLRFYKGDVIFGRRRAYQRKAGIATCDGFCSAHAMVIRANADLLEPKLLPFFLHSDLFMHRAVDISVGSLSPTINWGTLKHQEFMLPPKSIQLELCKLLMSLEAVIGTSTITLDKLEKYKYLKSVMHFNNGIETTRPENIGLKPGWKLLPIKEVIPDIEYGISISIPKNQDDSGIPIISTAEISRNGELSFSKVRAINYEKKLIDRLVLQSNDVLFNWRNSAELVGKSCIFKQPPEDSRNFTFASFILRLRCDEENAHNKYFKHLFNYYREVGVFIGMARKAVNQANFNKNEVYELLVPVPPFDEQKVIAQNIENLILKSDALRENIAQSKLLRSSILQQVF